jgi:hypothetical protein
MWKYALQSCVFLGVCLGGMSLPAKSENIKFSFNASSQSWFSVLRQDIRLTNSGSKTIQFDTAKRGLVAVTFNAECQLIARSQSSLNIDIILDQSIVAITNGDDAFCSGRGVGVEGGWARHSFTVAKELGAGTHTLRVKAIVVGDFSFARLDDITVLISR